MPLLGERLHQPHVLEEPIAFFAVNAVAAIAREHARENTGDKIASATFTVNFMAAPRSDTPFRCGKSRPV